MNIKTPQQLIEQYSKIFKTDEKVEKYVIYVRKSTDDKDRQVRSLPDQILECKAFADRLGLKVKKIIKESESAKEPGIRPKFREMMNGIENGTYDGIIAWHPDRLARNMRDAGEIIDLIDKNIIKELKFVSFTFENNASGKMLLGMAFVLSKQYSDKLSDDVKRGIEHSIREGKYINRAKHGYYKDKNQFLRPDKDSFHLIKQAFQMRLHGKSQKEIVKYLNDNNYSRINRMGERRKRFKMSKQRLSEILREPLYSGALVYGNQTCNLMDVYDFVPTISVEDFCKMNNTKDMKKTFRMADKIYERGKIKADLMRGMVYCGYCEEKMVAGITNKKTPKGKTSYFYYRCDNPDCKNVKKSVRAKVIRNFVLQFFKDLKVNKKVYKHYTKEMGRIIKKRSKELEQELITLNQKQKKLEKKLEETKEFLLEEKDLEIKQAFKGDLKVIKKNLEDNKKALEKKEELKKQAKEVILSLPDFLELFGNLANSIEKIKSMEKLDKVFKKLFLNFTLKDKKVFKYTLNSPFGELFKVSSDGKILVCRGERT